MCYRPGWANTKTQGIQVSQGYGAPRQLVQTSRALCPAMARSHEAAVPQHRRSRPANPRPYVPGHDRKRAWRTPECRRNPTTPRGTRPTFGNPTSGQQRHRSHRTTPYRRRHRLGNHGAVCTARPPPDLPSGPEDSNCPRTMRPGRRGRTALPTRLSSKARFAPRGLPPAHRGMTGPKLPEA